MVIKQNSATDEARLVMVRSLGEIRDAVRMLRESAPDSALARLAEEMIERMEQGHPEGPDLHGDESSRTTSRNG
ncbi:hypothetical protein [Microvirga makkahensis]|uniref:Uncharacterized protein n=1 Tax=Microvirga makkahensis TaxID=1128670 RepID=A0A7X3MQB1_9HYPH|nr:hypothetical protein [Microvirga makkahensis]MXQ11266.1 hypothetical protein [Microvirga makkahensis]